MDEATTKQKDSQRPTYLPISVSFQVVCITLSLIWFTLITHQRLFVFDAPERGPEIIQITPPIYQKFGGHASFANVGLLIERFTAFDMVNKLFLFTGYVWFKSNPGSLSLETLAQFSFAQGDILERSAPETQMIDNQLLSTIRVKVKFSSQLNYENFPFDDHTLRITLINNILSPEEMIFQSSEQDITVNTDPTEYGWHQLNLSVEPGYMEYAIDTHDKRAAQYHPAVTFAIDYERYGVRFILLIFLPLLIMFYIALLGFSLDASSAIRNGIGGVTGILGYRFVIDTLSPKVGYFMIADYIFFTILSAAMVTLIIHIITVYKIAFSIRAKQCVLVVLHLLVCGAATYFIFA